MTESNCGRSIIACDNDGVVVDLPIRRVSHFRAYEHRLGYEEDVLHEDKTGVVERMSQMIKEERLPLLLLRRLFELRDGGVEKYQAAVMLILEQDLIHLNEQLGIDMLELTTQFKELYDFYTEMADGCEVGERFGAIVYVHKGTIYESMPKNMSYLVDLQKLFKAWVYCSKTCGTFEVPEEFQQFS